MPNFDIIRTVEPQKTFRVASVMGTFDLQSNNIKEHFVGSIDLPEEWQIGLIVGNSGTGKTTIAKELFPDAYITNFTYEAESILDDMPKSCSVEQITKAFNSVGFSSPPSWLKPYHVLSGGEKMRVDLARAILSEDDLFVFDEFTSVVDRNVAKIGSFAMQKAIRKTKKKFIAVGCHFDVEDWLLPDWVFDTNTMTFRLCEGQKKNRPSLELKLYETKQKDYYWRMFGKYHYLSHSHNNAAHVYILTVANEPAAFLSTLPLVHPKITKYRRIHRLVVLPDYQGIGLGLTITNLLAEYLKSNDYGLSIVTSQPALIFSMQKSKKWLCYDYGRKGVGSLTGKIHKKHRINNSSSCARITASFKYVGDNQSK